MDNKRSIKKPLIGVIIFIVVIAAMAVLYNVFKPETSKGAKTITAEVVLADGTSNSYEISTDAEYLRQALEEKKLIEGEESEYGLYVKTVDGVTANEGNQEWWCFTKGGESINTGVDTTPIADGDHFEITLAVGY
ncbi:DUF4430 domain-containing protein [Anaerocolumna sp. AGMB13020]|uniref:DUF4430 domain-containing protein n=1 Tax=Anaerocolumna sp. AGMB13020 TaxID=3081750 RepID=UPI0029538A27|nr:DUF4430 domain-containing protein [Anaerocolumna sp. AGMB13020]WOO38164.1 DUF4430 domain-containing protein [Anaerocolumna sp. AGMB13020]